MWVEYIGHMDATTGFGVSRETGWFTVRTRAFDHGSFMTLTDGYWVASPGDGIHGVSVASHLPARVKRRLHGGRARRCRTAITPLSRPAGRGDVRRVTKLRALVSAGELRTFGGAARDPVEKAMAWGPEEQVSFRRVYCSTAVVRDQASFRQLGQTSLVSGEAGQKADTCWAVYGSPGPASCLLSPLPAPPASKAACFNDGRRARAADTESSLDVPASLGPRQGATLGRNAGSEQRQSKLKWAHVGPCRSRPRPRTDVTFSAPSSQPPLVPSSLQFPGGCLTPAWLARPPETRHATFLGGFLMQPLVWLSSRQGETDGRPPLAQGRRLRNRATRRRRDQRTPCQTKAFASRTAGRSID